MPTAAIIIENIYCGVISVWVTVTVVAVAVDGDTCIFVKKKVIK